MARGGHRNGAGRPKGAVAKHRKLANEATQRAVEKAGVTPLEFLLSYMNDPMKSDKDRLAAATAAASYCHPKLSSVDMKADVEATVEVNRIELVAPSIASDDHPTH